MATQAQMQRPALAQAEQLLTAAMADLGAGRHREAFAGFVGLLKHHRTELARAGNAASAGLEAFAAFCSRFVAGWATLVLAPSWRPLGEPLLSDFLFELNEFYPLAGSAHGDTMDRALATQLERFGQSNQADDFLKLFLLWTPESRAGFSPFAYPDAVRAAVAAHALSTIAALVNCSEQANAARNAAIALLASGQMQADLPPFAGREVFPSAWFRCSYADAPDKHAVKRALNAVLVNSLAAEAAVAPAPRPVPVMQQSADPRLRLVIPVEWAFGEDGAMYRCYAPILRDLRRYFFTIGLASKRIANPALSALFDQYASFEDFCQDNLINTSTLAAAIRSMNPAMVFYPSVGMLRTVIQLANLRLAPVQAMSVGHPASSMSAQMDYVITESSYVGDPALFSERALLVSPGAMTFGAPAVVPSDEDVPASDRVDIAVPAVGHKVGWPFLAALRQVELRACRPVRFHFFTGLVGTSFLELALQVRRVLPSATLYMRTDYGPYINAVRKCRVHAASFPFGGTNSVIDSLRMGLPVVALEGREVHERVDAAFMRQIGMDELVAGHVAGYVDTLVELVDDPERLHALRRRILGEGRVASELMGRGRPEEFSAALATLVNATAVEISR